MALLSAADILGATTLKRKTVHVKEWGGDVIVQELTATDRDAWDNSNVIRTPQPDGTYKTEVNVVGSRVRLVILSVVDADGARVLSERDAAQLGAQSSAAIATVYDAATELSGIGAEAEAEAEGNGDAATRGDSTPGSHATTD